MFFFNRKALIRVSIDGSMSCVCVVFMCFFFMFFFYADAAGGEELEAGWVLQSRLLSSIARVVTTAPVAVQQLFDLGTCPSLFVE